MPTFHATLPVTNSNGTLRSGFLILYCFANLLIAWERASHSPSFLREYGSLFTKDL